MDYLYIIAILIISGFASGLFIGIGSGTCSMILLPVYTIFIGRPIHEAIGSSLIVDAIVGAIAGSVFYKKGNVNLKSVGVLGLFGVIGAIIGSQFTKSVPETSLLFLTGIVLITFGTNLVIYGIKTNIDFIHSKISFEKIKDNQLISFIILGFVLGAISGFMGIGGGGFIAIILIFVLRYDAHVAIGTSLIMLSIIAAAGGIGHLFINDFFLDAIFYSGLSAGFGAFIGSTYSNKIDEDKLGRVIGFVVVIMGATVLLRTYYS
jgi:uncharacterized membrane protein YfcA